VGLITNALKTPSAIVKGWRLPAAHAAKLARSDLDKLEEFAKGFGGGRPRARAHRARAASGRRHP